MLTVAGMVAVINSVVVAAIAGLAAGAAGVDPLGVSFVFGAVPGGISLVLHECHHRRTLGPFRVDSVDQVAIAVDTPQDLEVE